MPNSEISTRRIKNKHYFVCKFKKKKKFGLDNM